MVRQDWSERSGQAICAEAPHVDILILHMTIVAGTELMG